MELEVLRSEIGRIKQVNASRDWLTGLEERKIKELEFHNENRKPDFAEHLPRDTYELLYGNKKFYSTVGVSTRYVDEWIEYHSKNKVFLDYACGNGLQAMKSARLGASLAIGLDISDVSVANATKAAQQAGISDRCVFLQGDCENTGLPDGCIDTILCSGMLHHLDLSKAFPELLRILKPGGRILAVEALDYNPAIKLYRKLTPAMRTEWEKNHILSLKDVRFAKSYFNIGEIRYWHLFSIACAYIKGDRARSLLLRIFNAADSILTRIPMVQLLSWQFTFEMIRPIK